MIVHYSCGRGVSGRKTVVAVAMLLGALFAASVKAEAQNIRHDIHLEKRYFLGEKIPAAFSITNVGPGVVKVKDAAMLKIRMELKGPINDDGTERRKYTYDGRRGVPVNPQAERRHDWNAGVLRPDV